MAWPVDPTDLEARQLELAALRPHPWVPSEQVVVGGCFVCFGRGEDGPGAAGDRGWAAAVAMHGSRLLATSEVVGEAGAAYAPGLLAAREGALLEAAVRDLRGHPDVLLVNATGRDHSRRAGLALHLGRVVDLPTVGVTNRPLAASGDLPGPAAEETAPLWIGAEQVGWWLRTRTGARPVAVSPGWRVTLHTAVEVVALAVVRARTPEPLRQARRLARTARTRDSGREA